VCEAIEDPARNKNIIQCMSDTTWFYDVSIVNHRRPARGALLTSSVVLALYLHADSLHTEQILVEQTTFIVDVYDGRQTVRNLIVDYVNNVLLDLFHSQVDINAPGFDFWDLFPSR